MSPPRSNPCSDLCPHIAAADRTFRFGNCECDRKANLAEREGTPQCRDWHGARRIAVAAAGIRTSRKRGVISCCWIFPDFDVAITTGRHDRDTSAISSRVRVMCLIETVIVVAIERFGPAGGRR
jgi:hypothetical protein